MWLVLFFLVRILLWLCRSRRWLPSASCRWCWRARCAPHTNSLQSASSDTQSPYEKLTNKRNRCCGCHTPWLRAALTRYSFTDTASPLLTYDCVYFYLRFNFFAARWEISIFFNFFFPIHFWVHLLLDFVLAQVYRRLSVQSLYLLIQIDYFASDRMNFAAKAISTISILDSNTKMNSVHTTYAVKYQK